MTREWDIIMVLLLLELTEEMSNMRMEVQAVVDALPALESAVEDIRNRVDGLSDEDKAGLTGAADRIKAATEKLNATPPAPEAR